MEETKEVVKMSWIFNMYSRTLHNSSTWWFWIEAEPWDALSPHHPKQRIWIQANPAMIFNRGTVNFNFKLHSLLLYSLDWNNMIAKPPETAPGETKNLNMMWWESPLPVSVAHVFHYEGKEISPLSLRTTASYTPEPTVEVYGLQMLCPTSIWHWKLPELDDPFIDSKERAKVTNEEELNA